MIETFSDDETLNEPTPPAVLPRMSVPMERCRPRPWRCPMPAAGGAVVGPERHDAEAGCARGLGEGAGVAGGDAELGVGRVHYAAVDDS